MLFFFFFTMFTIDLEQTVYCKFRLWKGASGIKQLLMILPPLRFWWFFPSSLSSRCTYTHSYAQTHLQYKVNPTRNAFALYPLHSILYQGPFPTIKCHLKECP